MTDIDITPENIREDTRLNQVEKETNVWFDKELDCAKVFSSEGGIMRRLVQHPLFTVTDYEEYKGNIVGLKGTFPIAALSFGSTVRKQKGHANVITNGVMNSGDDAEIKV